MISVTLTVKELQAAIRLGEARHAESRASGREHNPPETAQDAGKWKMRDVHGAAGEFAAAKALGLPLPIDSINTFKAPDLPGNIQVRTAPKYGPRGNLNCLTIRDNDKPLHWYLLVYWCGGAKFEVVGYTNGKTAKSQPQWIRNPGGRKPSWFVPADRLLDPEKLKVLVTT